MSYEPTNWKAGDTVTSAKLNKLEQGVASSGGGGMFMVHGTFSEDTGAITLDKTWREIYDAAQEKYVGIIFNHIQDSVLTFPVVGAGIIGAGSIEQAFVVYSLDAEEGLSMMAFATDSEDGYPTYTLAPGPGPTPTRS